MKRGSTKVGLLLLLAAFFCLVARGEAFSLEFSIKSTVPAPIDNSPNRSHFSIDVTGSVVDGDLDKFRKFIKENNIVLNSTCEDAGCDGDAVSIYLSSPGGSFPEALKISRYIADFQPVNTVVERESNCLSACAIIFMAGDKRLMFVGAKIGFHAPYISEDDARTGEVRTVYKASLKSVAMLVDVMTQIRFSNRLLSQMLSVYGQDKFFYIDTVDKAGRWGIDVAGLPTVAIDPSRLAYACFNMTSWASDQSTKESFQSIEGGFALGLGSNPSFSQVVQYWLEHKFVKSKSTVGTVTGTVHVRYAGEGTFSDCKIEVQLDDGQAATCKVSTYSSKFVDCSARPELPVFSGLWTQNRLARYNSYYTMFFPPEYRLDKRQSTASGLGDLSTPKQLPAGKQFSAKLKATDLFGTDIGIVRNTTQKACKQQCSGMTTCAGYTFDKWNRLCILKSDVRYSRLEPKALSQVKGTKRIPRSSQQIDIQVRKDKAFPGGSYVTKVVADIEACRRVCLNDKSCLGFNYDLSVGNCSLFDDPGEYGAKPQMSVGIKFQPAQ